MSNKQQATKNLSQLQQIAFWSICNNAQPIYKQGWKIGPKTKVF